MLSELRRIWVEDQYELIAANNDGQFFFGRHKNNHYQVFLRSPKDARRKLTQSLELGDDVEWFWNAETNRFEASSGFDAEAGFESEAPPRKLENLISGYEWNDQAISFLPSLESLCKLTEAELPSGARVKFIHPRQCREWILSLHGGPESSEGLEIRYGGLYRELIRKGIGVCILNYRGSTGLRSGASRAVWNDWSNGIRRDYQECRIWLQALGLPPEAKALFGASFGGALGLILQNHFKIPIAILSSPLLDLKTQMARSEDQVHWFNERFSSKDLADFSLEKLVTSNTEKKHIFYSDEDEVLGDEIFKALENLVQPNIFLYREAAPHCPSSYSQMKRRFTAVLNILLDENHSSETN